MLELEEQAIAAAVGNSVTKRTGPLPRAVRSLVGMDVQVGEVALAQRHQVATRAEVGLDATGSPSRVTVKPSSALDRPLTGPASSVTS